MSEGWIETCDRILERIRTITEKEGKDRLEFVQSMRFSLYALQRSILGWLNWVNNPDIMVSFNNIELEEMNGKLIEFVQEFIKYDIDLTEKGINKNIAAKKAHKEDGEKPKADGRAEDIFYI